MSRKLKYATLKEYQPYIDVIRKELKIPKKAVITVKFISGSKRFIGSGIFSPLYNYGQVEVTKSLPHNEVLRVLLHEFRHVWQYWKGIIEDRTEKSGRGYANFVYWKGKRHVDYQRKSSKNYNAYVNSPWEKDAIAYEDNIFKFFPGGNIKQQEAKKKRKLVGVVDGVKFYKIVS